MKILSPLFLSTLFFISKTFAQPHSWIGTKTPYTPQQGQYTPAPKGYIPIFINHVGRHGSRYMTKQGADSALWKILKMADKENGLTALGKQWEKISGWLLQQQQGLYGNITQQGCDEEKGIALRMRKNYPSVFTDKTTDVWYTHKKRTQQSAKAFLQAFSDYKNRVHFFSQPEESETMLRFYDYSPAYDSLKESNIIQEKIDSIASDPEINLAEKAVAEKLIKKNIWEKWKMDAAFIRSKNKKVRIVPALLTENLFDVYGICLSAKREMEQAHLRLDNPFSVAEGKILSRPGNAEDYLLKGPGINKNGIQVTIAVPLLIHLLNTSDSVLSGKKNVNAIFRFTHAEAISPLATLLSISAADSSVAAINDFDNVWCAGNVIPMGANIQWIFYSNGAEVLVKNLLNEKEVALSIPTATFPYYKWEVLKKFYEEKLKKIGVPRNL